MFIGYESFYCITVQIMQFPVLDFDLDHYGSEPFINEHRCLNNDKSCFFLAFTTYFKELQLFNDKKNTVMSISERTPCICRLHRPD